LCSLVNRTVYTKSVFWVSGMSTRSILLCLGLFWVYPGLVASQPHSTQSSYLKPLSQDPNQDYWQSVLARIRPKLPTDAQGEIELFLNGKGELQGYYIHQSFGSSEMNQRVVRSIQSLVPFAPLPGAMATASYAHRFTFPVPTRPSRPSRPVMPTPAQALLTPMQTTLTPAPISVQTIPMPMNTPCAEGSVCTELQPYMTELQRRIKAIWRAPRLDRPTATVVLFKVNRAGQINTMQITTSSGNREMDEAALAALSRLVLDPLPASYPGSEVSVTFTFQVTVQTR